MSQCFIHISLPRTCRHLVSIKQSGMSFLYLYKTTILFMNFHTEGRSLPVKRFYTLTCIICREILWKRRISLHRFFQRSRNLTFCLFLLYYMFKLCFSKYYLCSILVVCLLHHRTLLISRFTVILISSGGSAKKCIYTHFHYLNISYLSTKLRITFFFSNAMKATV